MSGEVLAPLASDLAALGIGGPGVRVSKGVITAVTGNGYGLNGNVVSARFDGAVAAIPNIAYLGPPPQVGDIAWCVIWETDRLMLGALGGTSNPRTRVSKTDAWSPTSGGSPQAVSWNVHNYSFGGTGWAAGNPTRVTAAVTGTYHISAGFVWAPSTAAGRRILDLVTSGTTIARSELTGISGVTTSPCHTISTDWFLTAGQYVELYVYQDSGAGLATETGSQLNNLCMHLISPGS